MLLFGILFALVACVLVAITLSSAGEDLPMRLAIMVGVLVIVLALIFTRGLKPLEGVWASIKIHLSDDYVLRLQQNIPPVRILRHQVTAIDETEDGLCVRTADNRLSLAIPKELEPADYQEIKNILATWATVRPKSTRMQNIGLLVVLLAGMGVVFLSTSLWLVAPVGVLMIGYYGYLYWKTRHVAGMSSQSKRGMATSILVVLFIVASKFLSFRALFYHLCNGSVADLAGALDRLIGQTLRPINVYRVRKMALAAGVLVGSLSS